MFDGVNNVGMAEIYEGDMTVVGLFNVFLMRWLIFTGLEC